jgi:Flp pilus assembly protein CpaB
MSPQVNKPVEGTRLVLIALGMALLAVLVTFVWVQQIKKSHEAQTMQVYLLTRDVHHGELITAARDVEAQDVPKGGKIETAFTKMHAATRDTIENFNGKYWGQDASQGQLVTDTLFNAQASTSVIPPPDRDKAHIAVPVTDSKNAGDIRPGDYVELRAPFRGPNGVPKMTTVIEKVKIIQLGAESEDAGRNSARTPSYRSATLEIDREDVSELDDISKSISGEFEMVLINPQVVATTRITKEARDALDNQPALTRGMPSGAPAAPSDRENP